MGGARIIRSSGDALLVVLAAGRSSRMGRPKALLEISGATFLELIIRTGTEAGIARVVVTASDGGGEVARAVPPQVEVVVNDAPHEGPVGGIRAVCRSLDGRWRNASFMVWPVDCPLVGVSTVKALLQRIRYDRAAVPTFNGRPGHPVLFGGAYREGFLSPGITSARDVIEVRIQKMRAINLMRSTFFMLTLPWCPR